VAVKIFYFRNHMVDSCHLEKKNCDLMMMQNQALWYWIFEINFLTVSYVKFTLKFSDVGGKYCQKSLRDNFLAPIVHKQ